MSRDILSPFLPVNRPFVHMTHSRPRSIPKAFCVSCAQNGDLRAIEMKDDTSTEDYKKKMNPSDDDTIKVDDKDGNARRLRKRIKRAKKLAKHLEELDLEENADDIDDFSRSQFPIRECKFTIPGMQNQVSLNPVVTMISVASLWGIVVWCTFDSVNAQGRLLLWQSQLSLMFTWLIQATKGFFVFAFVYVAWRYGNIKLGKKNEKPEFSNFFYSSMIFTAGAGNALLTYCVSEPMSHQTYNFFVQTGYRSQDEVDMFAINMAAFGWGLGAWLSYTVVAVAMSLAYYRFRLPMTYRSCFYPILGKYTWGWIGDVIDAFAIVVTITTVFTYLGLAAMNFVAGLVYMEWIDKNSSDVYISAIQNVVIWVLTIISLVSVVSGLRGVSIMCGLAMVLALLLVLAVFILEDTKYILNLQVQSVGYYLQTSIFELNFWTDTFGQLREGSGRAIDGKSAEQWWMQSWLNFSQTFWAASSAAVGQFTAYISRGRNLREVILYSGFIPAVYCLVWFCIWGGIGLRQSRQAMELGLLGENHFNSSAYFMVDGEELCYNVPQEDIVVNGNVVFSNYLPGITPVCGFDEENADSAIYNVLNSFQFAESVGGYGMGSYLSLLFMLTCAAFYMTVAGSSALIVDKMASSGHKNNHLARRMFWVVTVGALATALLSSGGGDALSVMQTAMILCGLPSIVLLCYLLQCIILFCKAVERRGTKAEYRFPKQPEFIMPVYGGILNSVEYCVSLGRVDQSRKDLGMDRATRSQLVEFSKGLVMPFVSMRQVLMSAYPEHPKTCASCSVVYGMCYVAWIGLVVRASGTRPGLSGLKWILFTVNGILVAVTRSSFRSLYNLRSNTVGDIVSSLFLWPQVWTQMRLQCCAVQTTHTVCTEDGPTEHHLHASTEREIELP